MADQELIDYIKTQLQAGESTDAIKTSLADQGWQSADIEAAFQVVSANPPIQLPETPPVQPSGAKKLFPLMALGILCLLAVGAGILLFAGNKKTPQPAVKKIIPTPSITIPTEEPAPTDKSFESDAVPSVQNGNDTLLFTSAQHGYSFRYLTAWKLEKKGSLTVLRVPSGGMAEGDALVSAVPYAAGTTIIPAIHIPEVTAIIEPTVAAHDQQVKDLATQLALGNKILPTTVNGLAGYVAVTTNEGGSMYNILLQGSKNMLLIQFPGKKSRLELNRGQTIVLESIAEM